MELTEKQKDALWEVLEGLDNKICPKEGKLSFPIEYMKMKLDHGTLLPQLLKPIKDNNVFLRIVKDIKSSKDLDKTVKELIAFYNNPKNEKIWKKEH